MRLTQSRQTPNGRGYCPVVADGRTAILQRRVELRSQPGGPPLNGACSGALREPIVAVVLKVSNQEPCQTQKQGLLKLVFLLGIRVRLLTLGLRRLLWGRGRWIVWLRHLSLGGGRINPRRSFRACGCRRVAVHRLDPGIKATQHVHRQHKRKRYGQSRNQHASDHTPAATGLGLPTKLGSGAGPGLRTGYRYPPAARFHVPPGRPLNHGRVQVSPGGAASGHIDDGHAICATNTLAGVESAEFTLPAAVALHTCPHGDQYTTWRPPARKTPVQAVPSPLRLRGGALQFGRIS